MIPNQGAFLSVLSHSEGTDRSHFNGVLVDPYRVCFGERHVIVSLATHPALSGEWIGIDGKIGEPLDFLGGQYVGERSTAAGRYQIRKQTFLELSAALRTSDFAPGTQDDMALLLIKRCGALTAVNEGDIGTAIMLCSSVWASLPGSKSRQPQATMSALRAAFTVSGGLLA
jgi:muramidase (phage lysozyme)